MNAKFRTVLRDGYYWLVFDDGERFIFLHRMARVGERFRPGQRA